MFMNIPLKIDLQVHLNILCGKFMLWNMLCLILQSMGHTNYKFPVIRA